MDEIEFEMYASITGESESFDEEGLDAYEQELSLKRAMRPELQIEFCGIPEKSGKQMLRSYEWERKSRTVPEWEPKRVAAFARKLKLLKDL